VVQIHVKFDHEARGLKVIVAAEVQIESIHVQDHVWLQTIALDYPVFWRRRVDMKLKSLGFEVELDTLQERAQVFV
jgi:hypothetical protein